jgi:replicative DNA helicase
VEESIMKPYTNEAVVDLEQSLLGCILIRPDALGGSMGYTFEQMTPDGERMTAEMAPMPALVGYLEVTDFHLLRHQWIYAAMIAIHERSEEIDNVTVAAELDRQGRLQQIGKPYLSQIANRCEDSLMYYAYACHIRRYSAQRQELNLMQQIGPAIVAGKRAEVDELNAKLDTLHKRMNLPNEGMTDNEDISDLLLEWYADPQEIRGYRTGLHDLDIEMGGLDKGELLILLGYTGSGKSTLMMQFAFEFCQQGRGLIIPTEMTVAQWKLRMVAYELGCDYMDLYLGKFRNINRLMECAAYIEGLPIEWFKNGSPTPAQIQATVRSIDRAQGCDWVIVDGVNDITVPGAEGPAITATAVTCLHEIARSGKVVACTAHMNRDSKTRGNKSPNPRDAFGSSRVEQLASRILTLWRPGHLVETGEAEEMPEDYTDPNVAKIKLAKSRFGKTGKEVEVMFSKNAEGRHGFWPVRKEKVDFSWMNGNGHGH